MSTGTKIEWTDATWNPIVGCSHASPGCDHCYAERMAQRLSNMGKAPYTDIGDDAPLYGVVHDWKWTGKTVLHEPALSQPLHRRKPQRIFVCSMADLFHASVPFEWIDQVMAVILACGSLENRTHTFQVLTKRAKRMQEYFTARTPVELLKAWAKAGNGIVTMANEDVLFSEYVEQFCWAKWDSSEHGYPVAAGPGADWSHPENLFPLKNLWLGVTAEDQQRADERIPLLLQTPAAVRFVSIEPMLGPVLLKYDRGDWCFDYFAGNKWVEDCDATEADKWGKLNWVICGGETGHVARPMHPNWARSLRDQCQTANVPFFFKGWGDWAPLEDHLDGDSQKDKCPVCLVKPDGRVISPYCQEDAPGAQMCRVGKKAAGRCLDEMEWDEFPAGGAL